MGEMKDKNPGALDSKSSRGQLPTLLSSRRTYRRIVLGVIFLALGLRLLGLGKGIWLDEYLSLRPIFSHDFLHQLRLDKHPPLYFVLLKFWSQVSMREEFLRILSVFFGMGTVIVVIKWIKRYSLLGGLLAGLYCATLPMMLRYSQEIRHYPLLLFATTLSFYFAALIIAEPEKLSRYFLLGVSLTIAVATHLLGVMILTAVFLYVAIGCRRLRFLRLRMVIPFLVALSVFGFFYFFFFERLPKDPAEWWMPALSLDLIASTAKSVFGARQAASPFRVIQIYAPGLTATPLYLLFVSAGAAMAVGLLLFGDWRRSFPFLAAALFYWAQVVLYSVLFVPIFFYRTVLPGMIPFMGFLGLHIATIRIRKLQHLMVIGFTLLCTVFATYWVSNEAWRPYEHWLELSKELQSAFHPNDIVLFFPAPSEGPIRYYIDLPPRATVPIPMKSDMDEVERKIGERVVDKRGAAEPSSVFLITRFGTDVNRQIEKHQRLSAYLESELGRPAFSRRFGTLSFVRYEAQKPEG
jgi:hypothetical protein